MVGAKGFEPSTLWSQTRCATRLRYAPTASILTSAGGPAICSRTIFHSTRLKTVNMPPQRALPWMDPGEPFPDISQAWPANSDAPGLLAVGANLDVATLVQAYSHGIFPWYSQGQPILWWSTDPRMVLPVHQFKLHHSLRKSIKKFQAAPHCEIRIDSDFAAVIGHCAQTARSGQGGTWIVAEMQAAYRALHAAGYAHSVETWIDGELVGGLYCVAIGRAVFGESMFAHRTDASKLALAALVSLCRAQGVGLIDCQQNTSHLASLGAGEIPRAAFAAEVHKAIALAPMEWRFEPLYWAHLLAT
jgi:leucyl/phenylalanyl-tRNA---protein transferase